MIRVAIYLPAFILFLCIYPISAFCGSPSVQELAKTSFAGQVFLPLYEESAHGKIKVGVLDFDVPDGFVLPDSSNAHPATKDKLRLIGSQAADDLAAQLLAAIKHFEKRDHISLIERSRLDEILREKKLQTTGLTDRTATEIGGIAGLDVIVVGSFRQFDNGVTVQMAKVVRVKNGEILGMAKEEFSRAPQLSKPVALIDEVVNLNAHSAKKMPFNLAKPSSLTFLIDVTRGNPVYIDVIPAEELENYKKSLSDIAAPASFRHFPELQAMKVKHYKRTVSLPTGSFFLIVRDNTMGILSLPSSDVKVSAVVSP